MFQENTEMKLLSFIGFFFNGMDKKFLQIGNAFSDVPCVRNAETKGTMIKERKRDDSRERRRFIT